MAPRVEALPPGKAPMAPRVEALPPGKAAGCDATKAMPTCLSRRQSEHSHEMAPLSAPVCNMKKNAISVSLDAIQDPTERRVEVMLRAKLLQWDRDHSGFFSYEEVQDAMAELRRLTRETASYRQNLILSACVLMFVVLLAITAGAIAVVVSKDVYVGNGGRLEASRPGSNSREVVVTTQEHSQQSMMNMLSFDLMTNEWVVSDSALRELDTVAFELANGSFYHFEVVEVFREDSGPDGETDKLEIATSSGTHLRVWESMGSLEAKWPGSSMWEILTLNDDSREFLDVDESGQPTEVDPPESGRSLRPPERLLAKGSGGVGAGYGHGRGSIGSLASSGPYGARSTHQGAVVGTMYHHRMYGGNSARECYSDETFKDGKCERNFAAGRSPSSLATVVGMCAFVLARA